MAERVEIAGVYAAGSDNVPVSVDASGNVNVNVVSGGGSGGGGAVGVDGSTTITLGGTAQTLFAGTTPTNGYEICNPDATYDIWFSDSTTAVVNGVGSIRVAANGGSYDTPAGYKPIGPVSVIGTTTGGKITARKW